MAYYQAAAGLGETTTWGHLCSDPDEIYLGKFSTNVHVATAEDLIKFVQAVGRTGWWNLSIRGATAATSNGGTDVYIVWHTLNDSCPSLNPFSGDQAPGSYATRTFSGLVDKVMADEDLRAWFPKLQIDKSNSDSYELTGPAGSVDFWQAAAPLWDMEHVKGPTQAFANRQNLFAGVPDSGYSLVALPDPQGGGTAGGVPGAGRPVSRCAEEGGTWDPLYVDPSGLAMGRCVCVGGGSWSAADELKTLLACAKAGNCTETTLPTSTCMPGGGVNIPVIGGGGTSSIGKWLLLGAAGVAVVMIARRGAKKSRRAR